jgi:hypothetical protein
MIIKTYTTLDELIEQLTIAKEHLVPGNSKVVVNISKDVDEKFAIIGVEFDNKSIDVIIY